MYVKYTKLGNNNNNNQHGGQKPPSNAQGQSSSTSFTHTSQHGTTSGSHQGLIKFSL